MTRLERLLQAARRLIFVLSWRLLSLPGYQHADESVVNFADPEVARVRV